MAKLVLSSGGTVVHQRFLEQARITIGREAGNDIVVEDPAVGRAHAAITAIGNDYILEDLRSVNGTVVNGAPVQRRILQHGDVIALGVFHLRYVDSKASSDIDLERTMLISGLALSAIPARTEGQPVDPDDLHVPSARTPRAHFPNGYMTWVRARARARCGSSTGSSRPSARRASASPWSRGVRAGTSSRTSKGASIRA